MEIEKIEALKISKGNFDAFMSFSDTAKKDMLWWIDKNRTYRKPLVQEHPNFTLTTDESGIGWGAVSNTGMRTASRWLSNELPSELSINYLELMAIKHGSATLYSPHSDAHIKLLVHNSSCLYKQYGGWELTLSYLRIQPEKFGNGALKGIHGSQHVIFQEFKMT